MTPAPVQTSKGKVNKASSKPAKTPTSILLMKAIMPAAVRKTCHQPSCRLSQQAPVGMKTCWRRGCSAIQARVWALLWLLRLSVIMKMSPVGLLPASLPGALPAQPGQPSLAGSLASFLSFLSLRLPPFLFYQHLTNAALGSENSEVIKITCSNLIYGNSKKCALSALKPWPSSEQHPCRQA